MKIIADWNYELKIANRHIAQWIVQFSLFGVFGATDHAGGFLRITAFIFFEVRICQVAFSNHGRISFRVGRSSAKILDTGTPLSPTRIEQTPWSPRPVALHTARFISAPDSVALLGAPFGITGWEHLLFGTLHFFVLDRSSDPRGHLLPVGSFLPFWVVKSTG